ncbi:MAG: AAA family ATPase, partial [Candidatus Omnitrophica bacterium]|nr:AAA family ATPase [Candidatus Omnitrophota bacterium]
MNDPRYDFLLCAGRVLNALQGSTILLSGNVHDLFYAGKPKKYVPLGDFLRAGMELSSNIIISYKITGPIQFQHENDLKQFAAAWEYWRYEQADKESFADLCRKAAGNPTYALELLRQMCVCSNVIDENGNAILDKKLLIIIEGTETLIPANVPGQLSDADRIRVQICLDWFKDPGFIETPDAVILISESRSLLNPMISRLPHLMEIEVPSPDEEKRAHFINWFDANQDKESKLKLSAKKKELPQLTAGLSILALRRLLKNAAHSRGVLKADDVTHEVKNFIERELGDIVEFKVPGHSLRDVVGCREIKEYVKKKVIPRFKSTQKDSLPGAAVCGPIGGGKTYFWEAVAAESGMIVVVLGRIRDKWFGESDVRLERLKRILYAFVNVLVFIDEADAQFTSLSGSDQHPTEKRIQAGVLSMMSDPKLRGKVKWLLLTARIDKLSHDMLRPGRPGSLVIPMLDPEGRDRDDFLRWAIEPVLGKSLNAEMIKEFSELTRGYFAAMFAELRSELLAEAKGKILKPEDVKLVIQDILMPAVNNTREYQSLCAKIYCNRKSL